MPLTVSNPRDLLLVELADILFVERMLSFQVLPELLSEVSDPELTAALAEHLAQTKGHVTSVERAFELVGAEPSSNHSPPFAGLKDQHSEIAASIKAPVLADLWHANAAIHTEHYEIAAYQALIRLAGLIGSDEAAALFERNLADERDALSQLEQAMEGLSQRPDRPEP